MKVSGNLIRLLFGVNLVLFVYSMLSPWVGKTQLSMFERLPLGSSGEEIYWSFQAVFYPFRSGYQNRLISWDFWFGSHERILLWEYWFSRKMYYYGFTYEWIRIFFFQLTTIFSGSFMLFRRWQRTSLMLLPTSFSILSVLLGLLLVGRFMFVWTDYANPYWGLPLALLSTLVFVALFFFRHRLEKRKSTLQ